MGAWEDGFAAGWRAREIEARGLSPGDYDIPSKVPATTRKARRPKRKLTAHNRFMSKELKKLKKKHPRTSQKQLFKKANAAWRRKKRR